MYAKCPSSIRYFFNLVVLGVYSCSGFQLAPVKLLACASLCLFSIDPSRNNAPSLYVIIMWFLWMIHLLILWAISLPLLTVAMFFYKGQARENVSAPLLLNLAHWSSFSRLDGTRVLLVHWESKGEYWFLETWWRWSSISPLGRAIEWWFEFTLFTGT